MPTTYTVQDAVDIVRKFVKDAPTSSIDVRLADYVNNIIYTAWPWRWTLKALTPIVIVDSVQDLALASANAVTHADGFYRLVRARIVRTDTTPDDIYDELKITEFLPPANRNGWPTMVSFEEVAAKIRLERPMQVTSPTVYQLEGDYQKNPTKITSLANTLVYPDHYFQVFLEGLLWQVYRFFGDSRAGSIILIKGTPQFTGQLGVFMAHLQSMKEAEDQANGDPLAFPDEPLGVRGGHRPYLIA